MQKTKPEFKLSVGLICIKGTNVKWIRSGSLQLRRLTELLALN